MLIRMTAIIIAIAAATAGSAQSLPADPVKHIDGRWYALERNVEIEVANGVATIKVNESEDVLIKKMNMPAGTVIGRFTGHTPATDRVAVLTGQCWTMLDTINAGLIECGRTGAAFERSNYGGKPSDLLRVASMQFLRKANMPEYEWKYRK